MRLLDSISRLVKDPPPPFAFEVSEAGIASARPGHKGEIAFQPLKPGAVSVSPVRDNIMEPDALAAAVKASLPPGAVRKRRDATLILPDYCARVSVLDFDEFPGDAKEQLPLVRFRIRKSVPFDVEGAALSYWPQALGGKRYDVVVVVAPLEIVSRYEAPFRAAGLNPGFVTPSCLAALHLVEAKGELVVAKLSGRVLTVMVIDRGVLKLVRSLELAEASVQEMADDLYPTFVYVEDNLGTKVEKLMLCGFCAKFEDAKRQFEAELGVEVEPMRSPVGVPGEHNAGLLGYWQSITQGER